MARAIRDIMMATIMVVRLSMLGFTAAADITTTITITMTPAIITVEVPWPIVARHTQAAVVLSPA
jgi:hypothetical protein